MLLKFHARFATDADISQKNNFWLVAKYLGKKIMQYSIESSISGSGYEQQDGHTAAYAKNNCIGLISWSFFENCIYINMIEVNKVHRRARIATKLYKAMKKYWDNAPVNWGMLTEDGLKFGNYLKTTNQL